MLTIPPHRPTPPLDLAAIRAADAAQRAALAAGTSCSREQIDARVAACRACSDSAPGSATCPACDLRCAHPDARPGEQLLAVAASTCPRNLWPSIA